MLAPTEHLIEAIKAGQMVVLMDDEDRENEGDLIMAAEMVSEAHINFMARFGRGLVCLPMRKAMCEQLALPLMVPDLSPVVTQFTVSIEAARGVTTGISAADRAHTIRTAVQPNAKPSDLVRPGHVFPIMAQDGGVLSRAGHTEAACDLAELAGFRPAGILCEIMNDDGTMARRPDLEKFAKTHNLLLGTIAELISHRLGKERTITRCEKMQLDTRYGQFTLTLYKDKTDKLEHVALSIGELNPNIPTFVRMYLRDVMRDLSGLVGQDQGSWPLEAAMAYIAKAGSGVIVILGNPDDNQGLMERIKLMTEQAKGEEHTLKKASQSTQLWRVGAGSQILADLGVRKLKVLGAPRVIHGLSGFGLEVVDYVPYEGEPE